MTPGQFAYQAVKYNQRKIGEETISLADCFKMSHVISDNMSKESQLVIQYIIDGNLSYSDHTDEECMNLFEEKNKLDNLAGKKNKNEHNELCKKIKAMKKFKLIKEMEQNNNQVLNFLRAVDKVKSQSCPIEEACNLIRQYNLPREVLNTVLLTDKQIWNSLLYKFIGQTNLKITMPITALIRNLGVMSARGIFDNTIVRDAVCTHIQNFDILKKGRVHPVTLLLARLTYATGKGVKGSLTWPVDRKITDALEDAFYNAFGIIEATGKAILHSVDCSGSMTTPMTTLPQLSSCQAVATLVMEAVRREKRFEDEQELKGNKINNLQDVLLFNHSGSYVSINPNERLESVMQKIQDNNFGSTDCAQPMIKALEMWKKTKGKSGAYDAFIIYTDNESYYGSIHPIDALNEYRKVTGIDARMIVVATTATQFTIGYHQNILDPMNPKNNNPLCLNIAGFDLAGPQLIRNFLMGNIGIQEIEIQENNNNENINSNNNNDNKNEDEDEYDFIGADE